MIARCKEEIDYTPVYFIRMIEELGAIKAVSKLVLDSNVSEGFTKLALVGRLDLSVEAVVLEDRWSSLFEGRCNSSGEIKVREGVVVVQLGIFKIGEGLRHV